VSWERAVRRKFVSEETKVASELLGIHIRENLGFRDGFFEIDEVHLLKVVEVIRKYQPNIILANAASDRHPDHKRAGDLVSRANFLSGLLKVQTENQTHWRAKAVYRYIQDNYIEPDFVVDISGFETKKLDAIKAFKSQFYDPNSNEPSTPISREDFLEFILARAKQFGRPINAEYGEGFTVERYIGVDNLLSLK
jgi:bacillithiol biosynthesis deacetylase BshB1